MYGRPGVQSCRYNIGINVGEAAGLALEWNAFVIGSGVLQGMVAI